MLVVPARHDAHVTAGYMAHARHMADRADAAAEFFRSLGTEEGDIAARTATEDARRWRRDCFEAHVGIDRARAALVREVWGA